MYGKLFDSMYDGTLVEDWQALITFQQMIVLCDLDGIIDMTPASISRRTGIPECHIRAGIEILEKPDPHSRTPIEDGKRLIRLDEHRDWGWTIVNHELYKNRQDYDSVREKNRLRKQKQRAKAKDNDGHAMSQDVTPSRSSSRHTDTDTDTDKEHLSANKNLHVTVQNAWNTAATKLPKIVRLTHARRTAIKARWNADKKHQSESFWLWLFDKVNNTPFLTGDSDRGWKATFDWVMKESNFTKIIEDTYER